MADILISILFYAAASIFTLTIAIYIYFQWTYKFWERQKIPYAPGEFIYGSLKDSTTSKMSLGEDLAKWYNVFKGKGERFFGGFLFHQPFFIPIDPELLKNIFSKDFNHFVDRGGFCDKENDPLSAHLVFLSGDEWRCLRKKLTPAFTSGKLKKMFQTLLDCTNELETCLDTSIEKDEPIDIKVPLCQYTVNVIGSCAFGIDCNSFESPDSEFVRLGEISFKPTGLRKIKVFLSMCSPGILKFFKTMVTDKAVDRFFRGLVKDTIEYREANNIIRNDFMHLLIQLKNKGEVDHSEEEEDGPVDKLEAATLTIDEIAAQAFLFFVAGYETSATTMTFCLYELAKQVDLQEKTRKEIITILKKHDGKISYDAIKEMQYLERVILETLRMYPPLVFLQRIVTKDYQVPKSDLVLKKDLTVFIPINAIHRDPEYYPNPKTFNPDRFTEENKSTRPDFTYLPFGDGPRICIGLRFGMMQTKIGICKLLQHYRFTLNPKTRQPLKLDPASFISAALGGIWLNAEKI